MLQFDRIAHEIEDGDLILTRGRSWRSWFIQLRTRSRFSHCGFAVWIYNGELAVLCVLEAVQGRGMQLLPLSQVLERDGEVDWFKLVGDVSRRGIIEHALGGWGRPYPGWWQFFRSFSRLRWLFDWLAFPVDTDTEAAFCSEAVFAALSAGGFVSSEYIEAALMSPGDIAELNCFQRVSRVKL